MLENGIEIRIGVEKGQWEGIRSGEEKGCIKMKG
jgi:hypothetical protein